MPDLFTCGLIAVPILGAYLFLSIHFRQRAEEAKRLALEKQFPGTAFDTSAIAPQIQQLRQEHLAAAQARPHLSFYRAGLMAAARRIVTSLSYFRRARPEHETQKHNV